MRYFTTKMQQYLFYLYIVELSKIMYINKTVYPAGTMSDLNRDISVAWMLKNKIGALASCVNLISAIFKMLHKEETPFNSVSDKNVIMNYNKFHLLLMNIIVWHCNANILLTPKLKAQQLAREERFLQS